MPSFTLNPFYLLLIPVTYGKFTFLPDCPPPLTTQTCLRCLTWQCISIIWLWVSLHVHQESPKCSCWRVRRCNNRKPRKISVNRSPSLSSTYTLCNHSHHHNIKCTYLAGFLKAPLWSTLQRCKWKNKVQGCEKIIIMKSWSSPTTYCTLLFFSRTALIYSWGSKIPVGKAAGMRGRVLPLCSWQCSPFSEPLQKQKSVHGGRRMPFITWSWSTNLR